MNIGVNVPKNVITLREVKKEDFQPLIKFLVKGLSTKETEKWKLRFDMWWMKNPAMRDSIAKGWLLVDQKSVILGFLGNIPFYYCLNGEKSLGVASTSWLVSPQIRGLYGINLAKIFLAQKTPALFLCTSPNDVSYKIWHQLGFNNKTLPYAEREYWFVLNNTPFISRKKYSIMPSIKHLESEINLLGVSILYMLQNLKQKKLKYFKSKQYSTELCDICDDSFSKLWHQNLNENVTTLYRDKETLNWLLFSPLMSAKRYLIKCINTENNELVGYVVFDVQFHDPDRFRILIQRDIFVPELKEEIFFALIAHSIELAKLTNISIVKYWAVDGNMDKLFKRFLMIKKKVQYRYLYKLKDDIADNIDHRFHPSTIDPDRGTL